MKVSIFIKSYPGDFGWLAYCLRSIQKFVTGYSEVVVVIPEGTTLPLTQERIVYTKEWNDRTKPGAPSSNYFFQMFVKLCADQYCLDADFIMIVDSDCVFTRPFDLSELFSGGKPKLLRRSWAAAGQGSIWRRPAEEALGFNATHDTMVCHPAIYRREDFGDLRFHIERKHKMPFEQYVRSRDTFIEFVTMGNFILTTRPEDYAIIDASDSDDYPRPIKQSWSWGGMNAGIRAELESLLS